MIYWRYYDQIYEEKRPKAHNKDRLYIIIGNYKAPYSYIGTINTSGIDIRHWLVDNGILLCYLFVCRLPTDCVFALNQWVMKSVWKLHFICFVVFNSQYFNSNQSVFTKLKVVFFKRLMRRLFIKIHLVVVRQNLKDYIEN